MSSYNKKGGFVSDYANASTTNDYMLYNKNVVSNTTEIDGVYVPPLLPNMNGGGAMRKDCAGYKECDSFEFNNEDSFLYSLKGGCACNTSSLMGGSQQRRTKNKLSGGAFALGPYITAISLLAARLLYDKQVGVFSMTGGNEFKRRSRK